MSHLQWQVWCRILPAFCWNVPDFDELIRPHIGSVSYMELLSIKGQIMVLLQGVFYTGDGGDPGDLGHAC